MKSETIATFDEVIEAFLREALTLSDNDEFKKLLLDTKPWEEILNALNSAPKNATVKLFDDLLFIDRKQVSTIKKEWKKRRIRKSLEESLRLLLRRFIEKSAGSVKA